MEDALAREIRQLLEARSVAALGTLHDGAPYVSMVPFVVTDDGVAFLVHVSALSAHTKDMQADPRVSLLVMQAEGGGVSPQALPRLTVVGKATEVDGDTAAYEKGRDLYLARFPDAAPMFELGDFSLFVIVPTTLRWVGGFARATTIAPSAFAEAVRTA